MMTPSALSCAFLVPDGWSEELVALHAELLKICRNVRLFDEGEEAAMLRQAKSLALTHIVQLRRNLVRVKVLNGGRQFDCALGALMGAFEEAGMIGENVSTSTEAPTNEFESSTGQEFHFLLSGAKHQRTLLKEKASKALTALKELPVLIHEIPRELLLAALDGKSVAVSGWKDAEERELALKLPQTIKKLFSLDGKRVICFYNHRDSTILKIDKFNFK